MDKIPEYDSLKRSGLSKAPEFTLRKIKRVYAILDQPPTAQEMLITSNMNADIDAFIDNSDGNGWNPEILKTMDGTSLSPAKATELTELARDFMKKAAESVTISEKVLSTYDPVTKKTDPKNINIFEGNDLVPMRHVQSTFFGSKSLLETYSSQLFLSTVSKIKSFGFSDKQSYRIIGKLIHETLLTFIKHNKKPCGFAPQIIPALSEQNNLINGLNYWEKMKDDLNNQTETYKKSLQR